jgi:5-methylcytosine-specific restriction endonuclease McrA
MFESMPPETAAGVRSAPVRLDAALVRSWTAVLSEVADAARGLDDAGRVDLLRALEELKAAGAGAQAVVTVDFDASQRAPQATATGPAARPGRGVAAQVALARRESPYRGQQHLGLAKTLVAEMPHTLAALVAGRTSEWRATILARETACLTRLDRMVVDQELAGDPDRLERLGDRELAAEAFKLAARLDVESLVIRRRRAESDRRVTGRPAPDTMMQLSALLPVAKGVAVLAALTRQADAARAAGDPRSRGQLMADTLVERVTGITSTGVGEPPVVPIAIDLVISDRSLLAGADDSAYLDGYGPIPAELGRELAVAAATRAEDGDVDAHTTWLRRLYARPDTGELVAHDSRARIFPAGLARLIRLRDQVCRTPWCDAPIRHTDHIQSAASGGATSLYNGQGLCEACNHAKQALGWRARPRPGPRHPVVITTPTGHTYESGAPPAIGSPAPSADWFHAFTRFCLGWDELTLAT